jgi:DNA-nicking Smr family endonuclease
MEGRRRNRLLSEQELELWTHVTRRDAPMARAAHLGRLETAAVVRPSSKGATVATSMAPELSAHCELPPKAPASVSGKVKPPSAPMRAPFDPREIKKIARGRRDIDARLDLHGLRQPDAYIALRRFLGKCQSDGRRHVLIITGKGGTSEEFAERNFLNDERRGVLRRLVPHWLSEPAFRLYVVSFAESARKHGGSGALYVTIRKGPRHPKL